MIEMENIQKEKPKYAIQQTLIAQFSSPLPPPEIMNNYEKIHPGLIQKIIEMTETESAHRRELEKQKMLADEASLRREDNLISRAQFFSFTISLTAIIAGCITAVIGSQIAGSIIGTSGLVGVIAAFLKNSKRYK